ncbi:hypothetical protein EI94DRAFT_528914 [Lactarius quietus]|nr:hypothetical protein EI94DRAFT_528914 [Lactarius quietus]
MLIHKLHEILRPFLLNHLKVDVERSLPPKKECRWYTPLTEHRRKACQRLPPRLLAGVRSGQDAKGHKCERITRKIKEDEKQGWVGECMCMSRNSLTTKSIAKLGAEHQL